MIIGNALAGLWSLGAHRIPSLRTRALWWFTAVAELAYRRDLASAPRPIRASVMPRW